MMPIKASEVKDSTVEKSSVLRKDSVFSFKPLSASLLTTVDSLVSSFKRFQFSTIGLNSLDSTSYVIDLKDLSDTLGKTKFIEKKSGQMRASLWLDRAGNLLFSCNTDSLKQKISWLEYQLRKEKYYNETKTVEVEVSVPEPFIPKYILWMLGVSLAVNAWVFRKPFVNLIKHFFKPW
jgi:hypothetical protein